MNNKKTLIQTVIIVVCFLASGIVLYRGLFGGSSSGGIAISSSKAVVADPSSILPNGSTLDFNVLNQQNFQFGEFTPPQLNPANDVGVPVDQLILPAPGASQ